MMDLLKASKKAFRTRSRHQADITYLLPLQILVQLKEAIEEEEDPRARIDTLQDDITVLLFDPQRINPLDRADEIAGIILDLMTSYLGYGEEPKESQGDESS